MAPRRNAKQVDAEPMEKVAEAGDVSPPKRTKMIKPSAVDSVQFKDTRLTRSTKVRGAQQSEVMETESEPIKKSRARNKVVPTKITESVSEDQTTKSKRIVKKGKTSEKDSSPDDVNAVTESENSVPQKLPAKKTRGKTVTEKAGIADSVGEDEVKPKTRAQRAATSKNAGTEVEPTKGKKTLKNVDEAVSKEIKTKTKVLKKDTEKDEITTAITKKKVAVKTKTGENSIAKVEESTTNEGKKTKAQSNKKVQNQTDNGENDFGKSNESKPVKGKQRKVKDDVAKSNAPKKGRTKKETTAVAKDLTEKELESTGTSEEEKETESVTISEVNNIEKPTDENYDELNNSESEKNNKEDSITNNENNTSTNE